MYCIYRFQHSNVNVTHLAKQIRRHQEIEAISYFIYNAFFHLLSSGHHPHLSLFLCLSYFCFFSSAFKMILTTLVVMLSNLPLSTYRWPVNQHITLMAFSGCVSLGITGVFVLHICLCMYNTYNTYNILYTHACWIYVIHISDVYACVILVCEKDDFFSIREGWKGADWSPNICSIYTNLYVRSTGHICRCVHYTYTHRSIPLTQLLYGWFYIQQIKASVRMTVRDKVRKKPIDRWT